MNTNNVEGFGLGSNAIPKSTSSSGSRLEASRNELLRQLRMLQTRIAQAPRKERKKLRLELGTIRHELYSIQQTIRDEELVEELVKLDLSGVSQRPINRYTMPMKIFGRYNAYIERNTPAIHTYKHTKFPIAVLQEKIDRRIKEEEDRYKEKANEAKEKERLLEEVYLKAKEGKDLVLEDRLEKEELRKRIASLEEALEEAKRKELEVVVEPEVVEEKIEVKGLSSEEEDRRRYLEKLLYETPSKKRKLVEASEGKTLAELSEELYGLEAKEAS